MKRPYELNVELDCEKGTCSRNGEERALTRSELLVLRRLVAKHPDVVSTRELRQALGHHVAHSENDVSNVIRLLREKLLDREKQVICTARRLGYRWAPRKAWKEPVSVERRETTRHDEEVVRRYIDQQLPPGADAIVMNGVTYDELRTAKRVALSERLALEDEIGRERAAKAWERLTRVLPHGTSRRPAALNRIAFYLAEALQLLGLACYTGDVALARVLVNLGDAIVDDWYVCERWVSTYRSSQSLLNPGMRKDVAYHRRHGEWLALAAALYMYEKWKYDPAARLLQVWGGALAARETLRRLTSVDAYVLSRTAAEDLEALIGIEPPSEGAGDAA